MTSEPKRRPGRPRKNPEEGVRSCQIHIMCTPATLMLLRLFQAEKGLDSLGDAVAALVREWEGSP